MAITYFLDGEDKASKDFREARANGRVLSSQVVKEFT